MDFSKRCQAILDEKIVTANDYLYKRYRLRTFQNLINRTPQVIPERQRQHALFRELESMLKSIQTELPVSEKAIKSFDKRFTNFTKYLRREYGLKTIDFYFRRVFIYFIPCLILLTLITQSINFLSHWSITPCSLLIAILITYTYIFF